MPPERSGHQVTGLGSGSADPQPTQRLLARADRHRGVLGLMRVDPIITVAMVTLQVIIKGREDRGRHA
jgi:hypothetical protein